MRQLAWTIAAAVLSANLVHGVAMAAEPIRCTCYFQQSSGYAAVGTRAVCSTMTRKNMRGPGERCEISFGGTGYEAPLVSKLKVKTDDYRTVAFQVTQRNLQALLTGRPELVSDAAYLRVAIPAYMRAVYLREGAELDDSTRDDLEKQVTDVASEFSEAIADVFMGRRDPFEATYRDRHRLSVERGAVRFVYASDINLVAVFFDPRNPQ